MAVNKFDQIWQLLTENEAVPNNPIPTNLSCMLCKNIIIDARQTPCGCRFCLRCITNYFNGALRKCPGGTEDCVDYLLELNQHALIDNNANREISKLVVKCSNLNCLFETELRVMVNHVNMCDLKLIQCTKCDKSVTKKDFEHHEIVECNCRIVPCEFCNENFIYRVLLEQHNNVQHDLLCNNYKSVCPNQCEVACQVLMKQHLRVCTNRPEPCPYKTFGCELTNIPKDKINEHLRNMNFQHTKMLLNQFENLHNEISTLKQDKELKDREITRLKLSIENHEKTFENKHNDFIWKIENFHKLMELAVNKEREFVLSKPFITDRYGYKLCLKLFPNGYDDASGEFVSLFCVILPGKYDQLLPWPFRRKVNFCLSKPNGPGLCKSVTGGSSNPEFGMTRFVECTRIMSDEFLFIGNSIYIKCSVE